MAPSNHDRKYLIVSSVYFQQYCHIYKEKNWIPKDLLWKEHQFRHEIGTKTAAKQSGKENLHDRNYFNRKDSLHGKLPEVYCVKIEGQRSSE